MSIRKTEIGFIGLGNMGSSMVLRLIRSGFSVTVYDLVPEKVEFLVNAGAKLAKCPAEVVTSGCLLFSILPDDLALESSIFGKNGTIGVMSSKEVHASMSTVSPKTNSKIFHEHEKIGSKFIASPVFGRPESAIKGDLYFCLSGDEESKTRVKPVIRHLSRGVYDFGENIESANIVKLAGNFMVLSAIQAMGEAMNFIDKNLVEKDLFADLISETIFNCLVYKYHANNIAFQNFLPAGFKLSLGLKDFDILKNVARSENIPMPLASFLYENLLSSIAKGRGDLDWSAITLSSYDLSE